MPPKKQVDLTPFKFIVQGVALKTDGTGAVLGEVTTDPVALYGTDAVKEWLDGFAENLTRAFAEQA